MPITCLFCKKEAAGLEGGEPTESSYLCKRCGPIRLTKDAVAEFGSGQHAWDDLAAITITLRREWEQAGRPETSAKTLGADELKRIITSFRPLNALEKMDQTLLNLDKASTFVGDKISINRKDDYPLYSCKEPADLLGILSLLLKEGYILADHPASPYIDISISAKGYARLRDIQKPNQESRTCFVAMWFTPEMNEIFHQAIKPAIEFVEPGENAPRYQAVKIDNFEHIHDINDEMIAQIRRSRFVVCDLTGHRGGVYFEAGFAYGLGLDVIYTCRKDWTREETLKDREGRNVETLWDASGREIAVKKEGVHFDLAHTSRIEWEPDKLDDFKNRLRNRIRAVIV